MTDSWLLAKGATIPQSADGPPDAISSSVNDDLLPATVDFEKSDPTTQFVSAAKSNSTRKERKGMLHFALNCLETKNISSFVRKRDKSLKFPEKLMLLLAYVERTSATTRNEDRNESIGWSSDGKVIVIRDIEHFTSTWLPLFFSDAKFSSFTRKLYRWGFRKTYPPSPQRETEAAICFSSDNFQKDDIALLSKMSSTTADKERKRIARCSAGSCSDKRDAPQTSPGSSAFVHRSSSPDGSQQSTTQQGSQWSSTDKAEANMSSFQSLLETEVGMGLRRQESAARLEREVKAIGPTLLQQTFTDYASSLRAVANNVDRSCLSHFQTLHFSTPSPRIPGNGQNLEPAELLKSFTFQRPDQVQSTEFNISQLLQDLQIYNFAIDNSLNSSLMETASPSTSNHFIQNTSPVALLSTSEQSPEQALSRNLASILGCWKESTSSQAMADSGMSNMSVASPVLSNHSILDSLLQQQRQQQGEYNQRLRNSGNNLAIQTVQSMLSEQEKLDALAEWIRWSQRQFT